MRRQQRPHYPEKDELLVPTSLQPTRLQDVRSLNQLWRLTALGAGEKLSTCSNSSGHTCCAGILNDNVVARYVPEGLAGASALDKVLSSQAVLMQYFCHSSIGSPAIEGMIINAQATDRWAH
jgi:hypothetical protein